MAYVIKGRSKKIRKRRKKERKKSISSVPYIMQSRRELELYVVVNVGVVAVFCLFVSFCFVNFFTMTHNFYTD